MKSIYSPLWLRLLPLPFRERLEGRAGALSFIQNSGWLLFDKVIRMFLGLFVGAWVARYLGPVEYGELAYIVAYVAFFQAVAALGLDGIIIREISRDKGAANEVLGTSFAMRLCVGVGCWLVAVGGIVVIEGYSSPTLLIAALASGTLIFQAADTIDLWFQSQGQNRRTVVVKMIAYLFSNILKVVLVLAHAPLLAFAMVLILDVMISALGLFFAYARFPSGGRWFVTKKKALEFLNECWPFMLSGLAIMIYMRIDQLMIKDILGSKALGLYSAVLPLVTAPNFVPLVFYTVLMPVFSKLYSEDKKRYRRMLIVMFRLSFYSSLLLAIAIAAVSDYLVMLLFGSDFIGASGALKIYAFSMCFTWLGVMHSLWLVNEKKGMVRLYGTVFGAIFCVIGNLFMIPRYGLEGAAMVAIISHFISAVGVNLFFAKESFILQVKGVLFLGEGK